MNSRLPDLRDKTSKLTTSPGVYIMKNINGEIIYIGKAKNLKNRVTSYFRESADYLPKVASMVENVYDYDFIVTDSEYEALVLECSLIKQHQPKYNILLKDDKGYNYIRISNDEYPRITVEKNKEKSGRYLGPYMSGTITRETVNEVNRVFRLPTCKRSFPKDFNKSRPCLNYHIHQCMGVCRGIISKDEYDNEIEQAILYIKSGSENSVSRMKKEMEFAVERLDFEKAAILRDKISAIKKAGETQKIIDSDIIKEADIIAVSSNNNLICVSVILYRNNKLFDKQTYFFNSIESERQIYSSFIGQYYFDKKDIPSLILVYESFDNHLILEKMLSDKSGHGVSIFNPKKGKLLNFIKISKNNASEELALKSGRTAKEVQSLEALKNILNLSKVPYYIEAYDISNLSSSSMVGGMIVFENGRPLKKAYKRFSIKESYEQNDYACMQEIIRRRLSHLIKKDDEYFSNTPDLILLDGGIGHVNAVVPIIKEFNLDIPIFGMVKDNKHRTRAIASNGGEISISETKQAFFLVTQIQDEVHRFSISYMRSRHKKESYELELTKVHGIGIKKAQKILQYYKTKENMKSATKEDLAKVAGINLEIASALFEQIQQI